MIDDGKWFKQSVLLTYFDDQNVYVYLIDYLKTLFRTSELGFLVQKDDIKFLTPPHNI